MFTAAEELRFEYAAKLRDEIKELRRELIAAVGDSGSGHDLDSAPVLGAIILVMFFGFITGGLARLAVPGPDPMPIWLTVAIGLAGSAAGGAIAIGIWGQGNAGDRPPLVPRRRPARGRLPALRPEAAAHRARMRSSSPSEASGSTSSTSGATRWRT